ncbi:hypothetical protein BDZ94DRAFT_1235472 [Collybia nuda]|uniref:Uncharacterized protein n=1 Tax=Collybia nuda TaxID=64659 RepID=A0A9P5Y634_9AGAR|nr:hypothetical protein BDZ94DRAFT_1235472 [Collybia nuda]
MHPSVRVFSARVHQPLIKFVGKRAYPSGPAAPHAHPAAPAELKQKFSDFVRKFEASTSSPTTKPVKTADKDAFPEFWQAPERFWRPRTRTIEDFEIDAIESGGASLH